MLNPLARDSLTFPFISLAFNAIVSVVGVFHAFTCLYLLDERADCKLHEELSVKGSQELAAFSKLATIERYICNNDDLMRNVIDLT